MIRIWSKILGTDVCYSLRTTHSACFALKLKIIIKLNKFWKNKIKTLFPGVGVYISRIEENSVAERAGLRPGDTILEVNGTPFLSISHEEALKVHNFLHVLINFKNLFLLNESTFFSNLI